MGSSVGGAVGVKIYHAFLLLWHLKLMQLRSSKFCNYRTDYKVCNNIYESEFKSEWM